MAASLDMEAVMEVEHGFGKTSKKPVDDAAPKRYLSAFFQWANEMRPKVMKENAGSSVGEIGKILGAMWQNTKPADRASFEAKAEKDKKVYEAKVAKYKNSASFKKFQVTMHAWKIHETKKPYQKDPNSPKKPHTAYMLYAASVRPKILEENPDLTAPEVMKEQSVWWKALSAEDRKPWVEKGEIEREKYQKKLARYMKTNDYQTWVAGRDEYKKQMKEKRNKLMGIKKRARSVSQQRQRAVKKQKRSRTPKRRSRTPKRRSRTPKRRSRTPKASKRSSRRRGSRRRARTPKAPKRSTSRSARRRVSRRRGGRRSRTPKASRRSASRSSRSASRRRTTRRARVPKASKSSASRSTSRKSSRSRSSRRSSLSRSTSRSRKSMSPKRRRVSRSRSRRRSAKRSTRRRRASRRSAKGKKSGDEAN